MHAISCIVDFEIANRVGDLMFVGWYRGLYLTENLFASADPLIEVQREAERGLEFAEKGQLGHVIAIIQAHLGLVRTLRGLTPQFGSFDNEDFGEAQLARNPNSAFADWLYSIRKVQALFHAGDYAQAIVAATKAQRRTASGFVYQVSDLRFYSALSHAAVCGTAAPRELHLAALVDHHRQLQMWAEHCPENFENRAALVGAEIARIEGRTLDAERLYEEAIRSARDNSFVHNEALANELAARFYAARGFEKIANVYLRDARYGYLRWGADGKVRQLDELYPHLREAESAPAATGTIGTPVEHLDLATVIKVSQAISGEIILEKLLDTLMHTAMAQAGAERALLLLGGETTQRIAAEATISNDAVLVQLRDDLVTTAVLPQSVLLYVLRTQESVILDDAAARSPFVADPYIRQRQVRSVLCVPLLTQAKLIGVLYLENNLAPRVFAPARIAVLKLLASQAAIALENTRLYRDVAEREAKIRRLFDANIIGIIIWNIEGQVVEANEAFLNIVGYDREDLASGRVHWTDLTPPEWRERDAQTVAELRMVGTAQPHEKEYFRKDGSRVPVLIGATAFDEKRDQGVGFVLNLTERRRAEESLHEAQTQLAHANRVATMGQLAASIAHEVSQPIAATRNNASAALNFLETTTPDLDEVREALRCIVNDADRAGDIVGRIRDQIKKAPRPKDFFDINDALKEVIASVRGEVIKNSVSLQTRFDHDLFPIHADRVQLQQVILNLILNAVEAMSSVNEGARELFISTEPIQEGGALVSVRDSGRG